MPKKPYFISWIVSFSFIEDLQILDTFVNDSNFKPRTAFIFIVVHNYIFLPGAFLIRLVIEKIVFIVYLKFWHFISKTYVVFGVYIFVLWSSRLYILPLCIVCYFFKIFKCDLIIERKFLYCIFVFGFVCTQKKLCH